MKAKKPRSILSKRAATQIVLTAVMLLISGLLLTNCTSAQPATDETETTETNTYEGKKILWVDSYHEGYEWSDGLESGVKEVLDDTGVDLKVVHMDTKRNTDEAFGEEAATQVMAEIETFNPDAIIACDDNAQKYLVVPYLKDTQLPVIFCGVNWDASIYEYPASNVTGMVEVDSITQMVDLLELFAEGIDIAYLTEDTNTEKKVYEIHNDRFFRKQLKGVFISDFEEFKSEFLRLQDEVDMIYIGNNSSLADWDEAEAKTFTLENTKIPSGSIYGWMAPYALLVVGKSAEEQGKWAAETALRILDGTAVSDIPLTENKESPLTLNFDIAEKLGVVFTPSMLRHGEIYDE